MPTENELLRAKLKEQDDLLKRLTEGALIYGTVVGRDGPQGDRLVVASRNGPVQVNPHPKAKVGDQVTLVGETMQIVDISQRPTFGQEAKFIRALPCGRLEISTGGHTAIVARGERLTGDLDEGSDLLVADGVVVEVVPPAKTFTPEVAKVTWDHIGGHQAAKGELREAIALMRGGSKIYSAYGARAPKGLLFWGPPGCGKTLLGKAAASELAADGVGAFMYVKSPEMLNMYVGNSEERIRGVFAQARKFRAKTGQKAILFFDEVDAIAGRRGSGVSSDMEKTIVPTLLTEMDGLSDSDALVILATNRPDTLDPAVVRDGRIDRRIEIGRPDEPQSEEILRINLRGVPLAKGEKEGDLVAFAVSAVHSAPLAAQRSGALIAALIEKAKRAAARRDTLAGKVSGLGREDLAIAIAMAHSEYAGAAA